MAMDRQRRLPTTAGMSTKLFSRHVELPPVELKDGETRELWRRGHAHPEALAHQRLSQSSPDHFHSPSLVPSPQVSPQRQPKRSILKSVEELEWIQEPSARADRLYLSDYDPYDSNFTSRDAQLWRQQWTKRCLAKGKGRVVEEDLGPYEHLLNEDDPAVSEEDIGSPPVPKTIPQKPQIPGLKIRLPVVRERRRSGEQLIVADALAEASRPPPVPTRRSSTTLSVVTDNDFDIADALFGVNHRTSIAIAQRNDYSRVTQWTQTLVEEALEDLSDSSDFVRARAAFMSLGTHTATKKLPLLPKPLIVKLRQLLNDPAYRVKFEAACSLVCHLGTFEAEAVKILESAAASSPKECKWAASCALTSVLHVTEHTLAVLVEILVVGKQPHAREAEKLLLYASRSTPFILASIAMLCSSQDQRRRLVAVQMIPLLTDYLSRDITTKFLAMSWDDDSDEVQMLCTDLHAVAQNCLIGAGCSMPSAAEQWLCESGTRFPPFSAGHRARQAENSSSAALGHIGPDHTPNNPQVHPSIFGQIP
eukprot:TRINITY_DN12556_c0_g2_i24.p1 TRINITY_DN12556_c0_g2~~TRINITY_DN12556_c0_g2_i24.p1  ORF type:complete len:535 (+),score=36.48 TRINITY_DN12556_c0_g2_i24:2683-4287(+)